MSKDPAAVSLGRRGGKARLKKMTKEDRSRIATQAVKARWKKWKEEQAERNRRIRETNEKTGAILTKLEKKVGRKKQAGKSVQNG